MDTPTQEEAKELYARFGLTAYAAQCLEIETGTLLLLHARVSDISAPSSALEDLDQRLSKKTLGALLKDVRKHVSFGESAEALMISALEKRNYLFHRFFREHAANMLFPQGRQKMVAELGELRELFMNAETLCMSVTKLLGEHVGITDEVVARELQELRRRTKEECADA